MLIIDGGFSRAYQGRPALWLYAHIQFTWNALVQHEPFTSTRQAIEHGVVIKERLFVDFNKERMLVNDTDNERFVVKSPLCFVWLRPIAMVS